MGQPASLQQLKLLALLFLSLNQCVNAKHSFFAQDGNTPLLVAAAGGHVEVVRMLLNEFSSSLDEVNKVSVLHTV